MCHIPLDKSIDDRWLEMLNISVSQLVIHMRQDSSVENYPLKFYWQIIGGLSKKLKSHWNYCVLLDVSQIYQNFHIILQSKRNDPDIEAYLSLVEDLKKILSSSRLQVINKNITFDGILKLLQEYNHKRSLAEKFGLKNVVAERKLFEDAKQEFISCYHKISQLLIKMHPRQNW